MATLSHEEIITSGLWTIRRQGQEQKLWTQEEYDLMLETEQIARKFFNLAPICETIQPNPLHSKALDDEYNLISNNLHYVSSGTYSIAALQEVILRQINLLGTATTSIKWTPESVKEYLEEYNRTEFERKVIEARKKANARS